jgi:hypothetical protein
MLSFCSLQIHKFCLLLSHTALVCTVHFDSKELATQNQPKLSLLWR